MNEITELDMDKYLVLKWDDIIKAQLNNVLGATSLCNEVRRIRREEGKSDNKYFVLNLDDEMDCDYFNEVWHTKIAKTHTVKSCRVQIKDIAVPLVNAILKAKESR